MGLENLIPGKVCDVSGETCESKLAFYQTLLCPQMYGLQYFAIETGKDSYTMVQYDLLFTPGSTIKHN